MQKRQRTAYWLLCTFPRRCDRSWPAEWVHITRSHHTACGKLPDSLEVPALPMSLKHPLSQTSIKCVRIQTLPGQLWPPPGSAWLARAFGQRLSLTVRHFSLRHQHTKLLSTVVVSSDSVGFGSSRVQVSCTKYFRWSVVSVCASQLQMLWHRTNGSRGVHYSFRHW